MPSPITLSRSPRLSDVAEYAYGAIVDPSARLVLAAGACPLDGDGTVVAPGDYAAQAAQVIANLRVALSDAGAELGDIAKTTVYVASGNQDDLVTAWEVVRDALAPHDPPSTLLGVAALGYSDQLVEVEALAAVGGRPLRCLTGCLRYLRPGIRRILRRLRHPYVAKIRRSADVWGLP